MEPTTSQARTVQCVVVTPEKAVLDQAADFVALPMFDGELGVLPGRAAMIGRLGFGELRIVQGKNTSRYYVDGGFVQVRNNQVTVLTPKTMVADQIKPDLVLETLKSAQKIAVGPEAQEAQLKTQQRARAQLRLAQREAQDREPHF